MVYNESENGWKVSYGYFGFEVSIHTVSSFSSIFLAYNQFILRHGVLSGPEKESIEKIFHMFLNFWELEGGGGGGTRKS